jgi:small-conductance mechanosensitive channel
MTETWFRLAAWATALPPEGRWLAALLTAVLVTSLVELSVSALLGWGRRAAQRTATPLDDDLLARLTWPGRWLGPVLGVHAASQWFDPSWLTGLCQLAEALLLTYVGVASVEILVLESWLQRRQGVQVPALVRQIVIAVVYGAVVLGIAGEVFEVDLTPLLATGSVTTVVVGLALQVPLSNLFAGIVLHMDRHPRPGQWLLLDGREALVTEIGWRSSRLRTFTNDDLVVPNVTLLNAVLVNYTEPDPLHGRTVEVPTPLDLPPRVFDGWVRDVLKTVPGVVLVDDPRTKTWLLRIDDYCLRYAVRFWVEEFRRHDDAESELLKGLWYRFHEEGYSFPAPFQAIRVLDRVPPAMAGLDPQRPPEGSLRT